MSEKLCCSTFIFVWHSKCPLLVLGGYFKVGIKEDSVMDLSSHKDGAAVEQSGMPGGAMLWTEEKCRQSAASWPLKPSHLTASCAGSHYRVGYQAASMSISWAFFVIVISVRWTMSEVGEAIKPMREISLNGNKQFVRHPFHSFIHSSTFGCHWEN